MEDDLRRDADSNIVVLNEDATERLAAYPAGTSAEGLRDSLQDKTGCPGAFTRSSGIDVAADEKSLGPGLYRFTPSPGSKRHGSDAPFYSQWIADKLHLRNADEQYGLWGTLAGSATFAIKTLDRARALAKYLKTPETDHAKRSWFAHQARLAPHELQFAGLHARRFTQQALVVAIGAPLLWVAWRAYRAEVTAREEQERKCRRADRLARLSSRDREE